MITGTPILRLRAFRRKVQGEFNLLPDEITHRQQH